MADMQQLAQLYSHTKVQTDQKRCIKIQRLPSETFVVILIIKETQLEITNRTRFSWLNLGKKRIGETLAEADLEKVADMVEKDDPEIVEASEVTLMIADPGLEIDRIAGEEAEEDQLSPSKREAEETLQ